MSTLAFGWAATWAASVISRPPAYPDRLHRL